MLSYILQKAQQFERDFGVAPTVVYINPRHYAALYRENPHLFAPDLDIRLGFRLAIVPASALSHPEAALVTHPDGTGGRDRQADARAPVADTRNVA
jgi:hypothetical protein